MKIKKLELVGFKPATRDTRPGIIIHSKSQRRVHRTFSFNDQRSEPDAQDPGQASWGVGSTIQGVRRDPGGAQDA